MTTDTKPAPSAYEITRATEEANALAACRVDPVEWHVRLARMESRTATLGGMEALTRDQRNKLWTYRKAWSAYAKSERPAGWQYDRLKKEWQADRLARRDWNIDEDADPSTETLRAEYTRAQDAILNYIDTDFTHALLIHELIWFENATDPPLDGGITLDVLRRLAREGTLIREYEPVTFMGSLAAGPTDWYQRRTNTETQESDNDNGDTRTEGSSKKRRAHGANEPAGSTITQHRLVLGEFNGPTDELRGDSEW